MRGPDGRLRDCYPVVMSFMVDYPEACLICLIRTNYACPICMIPKKEFSCLNKIYPRRTVLEMQEKIANAASISKSKQEADICLWRDGIWGQTVCIRNISLWYWNIFKTSFSILFIQNALWELPLTNIYSTITPDMLHQVKKGVWEHLINLTLGIIKQISNSRTANQLILELDLRISLVPRYPGLKKFSKGISNLSQITAAEYQQLMRVCFNIGN